MAFKLKSGNRPAFKQMGSSPYKASFPDADGDGIPDTVDRDAGDGTGKDRTTKTQSKTKKPADKKAYASDKTWKEGSKSAKATTGMSLNQLVAARKKVEKGSSEYNRIQNEINKALGNKTRHEVDSKKAKVDGTKITDRKGGAEAGGKTVVSNKTDEGRTRVVTDKEGVKRSVSVTGKDTKDKSDDVKTTARRTKEGGTATRTRTATDVSKTRTDAEGKTTKSTKRRRVGKGGLKDIAANIRAKKDANKKGKSDSKDKGYAVIDPKTQKVTYIKT